MNQPLYSPPPPEPKARNKFKRGAGIGAAIFTMLIATPLLVFFLKAAGAVIGIGFVIYFCAMDKKIHWAWRLLAALVMVGIISSQYQYLTKR
jgi:hypothetical protein